MNYSASTTWTSPLARTRDLSSNVGFVFVVLAILMLMVTALSVLFFMPQSLRLDEAQSLWQSSRSPAVILTLVAEDVHVPLYHELLHLWRLYLGDSVESARLMSLLFYLLSIPALYALGRRAYSSRVGLIAATLLAASPFMNWYANEIRMYTLFMFLTILNQYFFIKLWNEPRRDTWIAYAATAVLGTFTHYFFFLNLAAQAAFYALHARLFERRSLARLIGTAGIVIAAFLPWVWYVIRLGEASNQAPQLTIPTTVDVFNAFSQFMLGFQSDTLNTALLSLWPIAILLGFLALRRISPRTEATPFVSRYLLITVLVSFAIAYAFSLFVQPVFVSRYLVFTVPSIYLLLAAFLEAYAWRIATAATAALMFTMLAIEILSPATPVKENYEEAAHFLSAHAAPQDVIAVSAPFTLYPIEYYYGGSATVTSLPQWDQYAHGAIPAYSSDKLPQEVDSITQAHQNIWLLQSYDQGYNKEVREYFDTHFQRLLVKNFSPGLDLYEYQIRYDTPLAKIKANSVLQ